jgi:hypothetical protein
MRRGLRNWTAISAALWIFVAGAVAHAQITKALPFETPVTTATLPKSTVAGLPTCNASLNGQVFIVTDLLLPTILGIITGGGAVQATVHCNGTNWVGG